TWKGAAMKTSTKFYFSKRYHSMSSYSIEVLKSIAAHPEFGPYLDTVVVCISPYQVEDISDNQASSDDDSGNNLWIRISDNVFSDSMERIFGTIKRHRLSVAIGISDRPTINFKTDNIGHEASVLDENTRHQIRAFDLCRPSKPPHRCCEASLPRDESIVMEPMLAAAEKSGCLVHGLLLKAGNHISWSALSNLVGGYLLKRIGFAIDVEDGVFDHFRYNHATSYLELACRSFYNRGFASKTNSPMESWLLQVKVTKLRLQECDFVEDTFMAHQSDILSRYSRSLESIDIRHGWMLSQGDWGVIFNYLSRLPNLRHCRLAQLIVLIHTPDQEQDDRLDFVVHFPNNTSMIDLYGDKGQDISQSGGLRGRLRESSGISDPGWWDEHKWEKLSDEEFCKTDVNPFTGTATSTGWKHGIFTCCNRNRLSWVGNGTMKGSTYLYPEKELLGWLVANNLQIE
ncbi:unnamed protein product, partial [Aureobasidium pullulans]